MYLNTFIARRKIPVSRCTSKSEKSEFTFSLLYFSSRRVKFEWPSPISKLGTPVSRPRATRFPLRVRFPRKHARAPAPRDIRGLPAIPASIIASERAGSRINGRPLSLVVHCRAGNNGATKKANTVLATNDFFTAPSNRRRCV